MGELLKLYMGKSRHPSHALWVGASRVVDPRPLTTVEVVSEVLESFGGESEDDWATVADELREAISESQSR